MSAFSEWLASAAEHFGLPADVIERSIGVGAAAQVAATTQRVIAGSWLEGGVAIADDTVSIAAGATSGTITYTTDHYTRLASVQQDGEVLRGLVLLVYTDDASKFARVAVRVTVTGILPDAAPYEAAVTLDEGSIFIPIDPLISGAITITLKNMSSGVNGCALKVTLLGRSVPPGAGAESTREAARVAGYRPEEIEQSIANRIEADDDDDDDDEDGPGADEDTKLDPTGVLRGEVGPLHKAMGAKARRKAREHGGVGGQLMSMVADLFEEDPVSTMKAGGAAVKAAKQAARAVVKASKAKNAKRRHKKKGNRHHKQRRGGHKGGKN